MRASLATWLAAAVLLAAGLVGYRTLFSDPAPATPPPAPEVVQAQPVVTGAALGGGGAAAPADELHGRFELAEVDGVVEVRRDGAWLPVRRGEALSPGEAIRTGDAGRATLRTAEGDELELRPRVELEVDTLDRTVGELTLTRGKVRASATAGKERFEIRSGEATATGKGGGRFTVYADGRGAITVASDRGDVRVVGGGREVTVGAREQTYVPAGGAPGDPVAIPDEVFLTVAWPSDEVHARSAVLRGRTRPGTQIEVNGEPVPVEADGSFTAKVPVKTGKNKVAVVAEGIDGREKKVTGHVEADTTGPPLEADPSKLYDPPPKPGPKK